MIKRWEEDEFLSVLGEEYEVGGNIISFEEAVVVLGFLLNFGMGCTDLGAEKLAEKFSRRADLFIMGLQDMGYYKGVMGGGKWTRERGPVDRIMSAAMSRIRIPGLENVSYF
jgi:hypothetical protein